MFVKERQLKLARQPTDTQAQSQRKPHRLFLPENRREEQVLKVMMDCQRAGG